MPQNPAIATRLPVALSEMAHEAKGQDYIYLSSNSANPAGPKEAIVAVYTYPQLESLGVWGGERGSGDGTRGVCSDAAGDVFAPLFTKEIVEFAHGGISPVKSLPDPSGHPSACSVDPTSGNLAVVEGSPSTFPGVLLIYPAGSGTPTTYKDKYLDFYHVGYDNKGNLFLDGTRPNSNDFGLAELPSGGSSFEDIKLDKALKSPGVVQWDGAYMTVSGAHAIHRFTVNGSRGTVIGSTRIREYNPCRKGGSCSFYVSPGWIQGDVVIGITAYYLNGVGCSGGFALWHYPGGGRPFNKGIGGLPNCLGGITISVAPK
jgi:hypothetical protein